MNTTRMYIRVCDLIELSFKHKFNRIFIYRKRFLWYMNALCYVLFSGNLLIYNNAKVRLNSRISNKLVGFVQLHCYELSRELL